MAASAAPVYVLTRTSGRPRYYAALRDSLLAQKYDGPIVHVVSCDDEESEAYVERTRPDARLRVYRVPRRPRDPRARKDGLYHAPYNLYFEFMYTRLLAEEAPGWLLHLDDDDAFAHDLAVATIMRETVGRGPGTVVQWQHRMGANVIPEREYLGADPKRYHITTCTFLFHTGALAALRPLWDTWAEGDFRCARAVFAASPDRRAVPRVLTRVQRASGDGGLGARDDAGAAPRAAPASPAPRAAPAAPRPPPPPVTPLFLEGPPRGTRSVRRNLSTFATSGPRVARAGVAR